MTAPPRPPLPALLAAFAISGAAALVYEVAWNRALSLVLGSSTWAVSTMLATFMLGLGLGAALGGRWADRGGTALSLGLAELGIGALGILSHLALAHLPAAHLHAFRTFHASGSAYFAAQIGLCASVVLPPTILMGSTFPLAARLAVHDAAGVGRAVGLLYGVNTLGAVAGALCAGFALVPVLGVRGATFAAATANATAAALLLGFAGRGRRWLALLAPLAYVPLAYGVSRAETPWSVVNFYSAHRYLDPRSYDRIAADFRKRFAKVFERDGADGRVEAFRSADGHLLLSVAGRLEGTTAVDLDNARALTLLPVAAHPAPRRMLVIGLGAGVTLQTARHLVPDVGLAEISDTVLEAVTAHGPPGLLDGIAIHRDDARSLLLRTEERWDVISSEPSYPTDFAVANLFTVEYFRIAALRLAPDGVYCQWLPYHMLTDDAVTMMVKTFATAFPHATLWRVEDSLDLLLLGSRSPPARPPTEILARVTALNGGDPLGVTLSRDSEAISEIARRPGVPLNTDDRPRLEFAVARAFRTGRPHGDAR